MKIESATNELPEIASDKVISFPQGLVGFEDQKEFHIYQHHEDDVVGYLQSITDPELTLSIISPEDMQIFYEFTLSDDEEALLGAESAGDLSLFLIAYKSEDGQQTVSPLNVNANFKAPLLINSKARIGLQKVLVNAQRRITIKDD